MSDEATYTRLYFSTFAEDAAGEVVEVDADTFPATLANPSRLVARTSVSVRDPSAPYAPRTMWVTFAVSTVFLGICHGVDAGQQVLYETAVAVMDGDKFGPWDVMYRYTSRKNALLGHTATIAALVASDLYTGGAASGR